MKKIHFIPEKIRVPKHKISISLIGTGGTGSHILTGLARLDYALINTGHPGIRVVAYDHDTISQNNIGRQNFNIADIGKNKAINLVSKINTTFGLNWTAVPRKWNNLSIETNIIISAVDNIKTRREINDHLNQGYNSFHNHNQFHYWMDCGNAKDKGQIILGSKTIDQAKSKHLVSNKLPTIIDLFPNLEKYNTKEIQGLGCSYADSLEQQSLFINSLISVHALNMIYELLTSIYIEYSGIFINFRNLNKLNIK